MECNDDKGDCIGEKVSVDVYPASSKLIEKKTKITAKNGKKDKKNSTEFPNFAALTKEEKLAFFEALSAARRNVERTGALTRETFGTVHDEYLDYFAASSTTSCATQGTYTVSWVPDDTSADAASRESGASLSLGATSDDVIPTEESALANGPSPALHVDLSNLQTLTLCEAVFDEDSNKIVQLYLKKKKLTEKKECLENVTPNVNLEMNAENRSTRIATVKLMPKFHALNIEEKNMFFKTLKQAHDNVHQKNPEKEILPFESILKRYEAQSDGAIALSTSSAAKAKEQTLLKVKMTLTSMDNERLRATSEPDDRLLKQESFAVDTPRERESQPREKRDEHTCENVPPRHEDLNICEKKKTFAENDKDSRKSLICSSSVEEKKTGFQLASEIKDKWRKGSDKPNETSTFGGVVSNSIDVEGNDNAKEENTHQLIPSENDRQNETRVELKEVDQSVEDEEKEEKEVELRASTVKSSDRSPRTDPLEHQVEVTNEKESGQPRSNVESKELNKGLEMHVDNVLMVKETPVESTQTTEVKVEEDETRQEEDNSNRPPVDKTVLAKLKNLVSNVEERKGKPEVDHSGREYLQLLSGYVEYLSEVVNSLAKTENERVDSPLPKVRPSLTSPDVYLKFTESVKERAKEKANGTPRRSVSHSVVTRPETSKSMETAEPEISSTKKDHKENTSSLMLVTSSAESVSTSDSDDDTLLVPMFVRKKRLPTTKIRVLQNLLKERAEFVAGSISEFKIVSVPHEEVDSSDTPTARFHVEEEEEEEEDVRSERGAKSKFFKALAKLCTCGKKDVTDEENILENLKGEAVAVDVSKATKNPASVTQNESTMEVLKAAERKKIIQKYWKTA